jgi:hypothetical protein
MTSPSTMPKGNDTLGYLNGEVDAVLSPILARLVRLKPQGAEEIRSVMMSILAEQNTPTAKDHTKEDQSKNSTQPVNKLDFDQPLSYVIFGATGDLAKKKLFPALGEWLPDLTYVIFHLSRAKINHQQI